MDQSVAPAILGAGSVRFDIYNPDTRSYQGLGDKLEADKFEITGDSELKERISKSREAYGQSVASVALAKPTKLAISIASASAETLGLQFQGISTPINQGAASVTAEPLVGKLDKWVKLDNRNIATTGFVLKSGDGITTYDLGDDFIVNYATGEVKALSTGAIAADAALTVAYTSVAYEGTLIRGGVRTQVRVRAVWQGVNQVDGQYIEVDCYEAVLSSGNGFDFLASDFNTIELAGSLVVPPGKTEPYTVKFLSVG